MDGRKTPEEIRDLFIEVTDEDKKLTAAAASSGTRSFSTRNTG